MNDRPQSKTPRDSNFFIGIADHLRLVWMLWKDPRVSPFLKLLPVGSLIYLISPLDMAIPIIDDVGILWFFTYLFIELSPQDIVDEYRQSIRTTVFSGWKDEEKEEPSFQEEDIQDAEFKERT